MENEKCAVVDADIVVCGVVSAVHSFLVGLAFLPALIVAGIIIFLCSLRLLHVLTRNDFEFALGILLHRFHSILPRLARL